MITHKIKVDIPIVTIHATKNNSSVWPWKNGNYQQQQASEYKRLDKLSYSRHIDSILIPVGSIIIFDFDGKLNKEISLKKEKFSWHILKGIEEIHTQAKYYEDYKPRCLYIKNIDGKGDGFWAPAGKWFAPPDDWIPDEVKEIVNSSNNRT